MAFTREPSSFRDDRGFIFLENHKLYRQINSNGIDAYLVLMTNGLYKKLITDKLLIPHKEAHKEKDRIVIQPEIVPFISYPYEWSFSQLKDAALTTLEIQKKALESGMTLRDASAYNIQFLNGKPLLIDTLSFDVYTEGDPWVAYRQFCHHFLAPLLLMKYVDLSSSQLLRVHIDGIPLSFTHKLLPAKAKMRPGVVMHIGLHAKMQKQHEGTHKKVAVKVTKTALLGTIDSLERLIRSLKLPNADTEWGDYYNNTNYNDESFEAKKSIVTAFLKEINPKTIADMGANNGLVSRLSAEATGADVISADIDSVAVEENYQIMKAGGEKNIHPLLLDLTNPSPGLGWANQERKKISERLRVDAVTALALVHHLAITNNVRLEMIAEYFASLGKYLIIEFVPKEDSQVQKLLSTREDIFTEYHEAGFEGAFKRFYFIKESKKIEGSSRTLYLLERKA